uniref:Uncharacterized protein n=1 Tax=Romanomermis culicivorax TaxID=13658 RepID=A0A915JAJ1_ROMCU
MTIKYLIEQLRVIMITGDNSLTACHVARELRFFRKAQALILDNEGSGNFEWHSIDRKVHLPVVPEIGHKTLVKEYDLCLTGQAFACLLTNHGSFLDKILPCVKVFARMAPKQKEHVITRLKQLGHVTLMCGDGTNDVGALKHAHVGVALLSHPLLDKEKERLKEAADKFKQQAPLPPNSIESAKSRLLDTINKKRHHPRMQPSRRDEMSAASHSSETSTAQKKINQMLKQIEEEEKAQIIRLGDASIAAPFTSKYSSIQSICHVIKQGRCTLVTTLQMFKILALNALVLAYGQSVLYLGGVKFSDSQATVQGLLLAACFLFVSRSKPLKTLAKQKPLANIFNIYTLSTVTLQFAVHLSCLLFLVQEPLKTLAKQKPLANIFNIYTLSTVTLQFAVHLSCLLYLVQEKRFKKNVLLSNYVGKYYEKISFLRMCRFSVPEVNRTHPVKLDEPFKPNLLNTTVYIISVTLQLSTFAVNYRGHPFMESLLENKALLMSVLFSLGSILMLSSGMAPELSAKFELVDISNEFRMVIWTVLACDFLGCFTVDRILLWIFGDIRIR